MNRDGDDARRDVMRQAPPVYGLARLAGVFRPLPPTWRTVAALALMASADSGVEMAGIASRGSTTCSLLSSSGR